MLKEKDNHPLFDFDKYLLKKTCLLEYDVVIISIWEKKKVVSFLK